MLTCGVEKVPRGRRLWLTPQLDRSKGRVLARPRDPWARLQFGMIVRLPLPARGAASPMSNAPRRPGVTGDLKAANACGYPPVTREFFWDESAPSGVGASRETRSYGDPLVKIQNRGQGVLEDGEHGGDPASFLREKFRSREKLKWIRGQKANL